ncbi:hypothetical protein BKA83DRAFT_4285147 [Pisolithus microcarpus]|nr:hypothetical protein BKA83DRAFT_4285147 [Pisolithus microcarpus]
MSSTRHSFLVLVRRLLSGWGRAVTSTCYRHHSDVLSKNGSRNGLTVRDSLVPSVRVHETTQMAATALPSQRCRSHVYSKSGVRY